MHRFSAGDILFLFSATANDSMLACWYLVRCLQSPDEQCLERLSAFLDPVMTRTYQSSTDHSGVQNVVRTSWTGLARKHQWYISMIHIMIVSWYFQAKILWYFWYFRYFWYFQNSKQLLLLLSTCFSNSCIPNTNFPSP